MSAPPARSRVLRSAPAMTRLEGVFSVLPTPFTAGDDVDHDSLRRVIDLYLAAGVDGVTALGVTGEVARLSERGARARSSRPSSRTCGGPRAGRRRARRPRARRSASSAARAARDAGAAAVMVSPPRMPKLNSDAVVRALHGARRTPWIFRSSSRTIRRSPGYAMEPALLVRIAREIPVGAHDQARGSADAFQDRAHPGEGGRASKVRDLRRPRRRVPDRGAARRRDRRDDRIRVSGDARRDRAPLPRRAPGRGGGRLLPQRRAHALRVPGRHRDGDPQGGAAAPRRDRARRRAGARRRRSTPRRGRRSIGCSPGSTAHGGGMDGPRPEGKGRDGRRREPRPRLRGRPRRWRPKARASRSARATPAAIEKAGARDSQRDGRGGPGAWPRTCGPGGGSRSVARRDDEALRRHRSALHQLRRSARRQGSPTWTTPRGRTAFELLRPAR